MKRLMVLPIAIVLASLPVWAGAELVLVDDRVLSGKSVERKEEFFLLEMPKGGVIAVPAELVKELRLTGGADPAPTGIRLAEPRTLAGLPLALPAGPRDQLAAFGRPSARFAAASTDSRWRPTNAWPPGKDVTNFNPSSWAKPSIDPTWSPVSAFKASKDVTEFNPARWYESPTRSAWQPRDAWGSTIWFPPVVGHRE